MVPCKCISRVVYKGRIWEPGDLAGRGFIPCGDKFEYPAGPIRTEPIPAVSGGLCYLIGCGPSGFEFVAPPGAAVAVVNRAGISYPGVINYWITIHQEFLALWWHRRKKKYGPGVPKPSFIGKLPIRSPVLSILPDGACSGSSALFALNVLGVMGYTEVITAGVDFTGEYSIFKPVWDAYVKGSKLVVSRAR